MVAARLLRDWPRFVMICRLEGPMGGAVYLVGDGLDICTLYPEALS